MNRRNECEFLNAKLYLNVKYLLIFHTALTVLWEKYNSFSEKKSITDNRLDAQLLQCFIK